MNSILNKLTNSHNQRTAIVKQNVLASFAIKVISIIVSLALVPMTLEYVSSEIYGIWLTISSIIVWISFFDIGFNLGLKNRLAEAISNNDFNRGRSLVSTTYFLMIVIFCPLVIVGELLIPLVNWSKLLNIGINYNAEVMLAIRILLFCFCMNMIAGVLTSVIAAYQKTALSKAFPVIGNIVSLGTIYLMTKFCPPSLPALTFAVSIIPILVLFIASVFLFNTLFKSVKPSWDYVDKRHIRDLFDLGIKFFVIKLQIVVLYQMTNFLISNVSGPNDVTAYNIAYKYLHVIMMAYTIILDPLWPAFTDAYTKGDFSWMRKTYKKMMKIYCLLIIGLGVMVALSPIAYNLWIGNRATIPMIMTITVAIYISVSSWVQLQVMLVNGTGKVLLQTYVTLIGLVFHIPMSLFLGHFYQSIGVLLSMIIINLIYSFFFTIQINRLIRQKASGVWLR